jgi:hypothetical protein
MTPALRSVLVLVLVLVLGRSIRAEESFKLHYDAAPHQEGVACELSLSITIEGTDNATNFVRTMHPLLSLNHFHSRSDGYHKSTGTQHKVDHNEARVNVRYDDEDSEYDWKRAEPPADLAKNKLAQMIWYLAMSTRSYELGPQGAYKNEDANQDHNGEALDLFSNGITRLKEEPVKEGDSWTEKWQGSRSEKNKKGKWRFTQVVKVEKIEERAGRRIAVLTSDLTGVLEGDEDKNAEEKWTKCAGKTRVVLDVATGKIKEQSGEGLITGYFKNTAEDGSKNEVTLKFGVAGSRKSKR